MAYDVTTCDVTVGRRFAPSDILPLFGVEGQNVQQSQALPSPDAPPPFPQGQSRWLPLVILPLHPLDMRVGHFALHPPDMSVCHFVHPAFQLTI